MVQQQKALIKYCANWKIQVSIIMPAYMMSDMWGPEQQAISAEMAKENIAEIDDGDSEDEEMEIEQQEEDDELWDAIEMSAFADAYRPTEDHLGFETDIFAFSRSPSPEQSGSRSPRKKVRTVGAYEDINPYKQNSISPRKRNRRLDDE